MNKNKFVFYIFKVIFLCIQFYFYLNSFTCYIIGKYSVMLNIRNILIHTFFNENYKILIQGYNKH